MRAAVLGELQRAEAEEVFEAAVLVIPVSSAFNFLR